MKKIVLTLTALCLMVSCKPTPTEPTTPENVVSGLITEDITWYADTIYEMAGKVIVEEGATLTIQAGTLIKARDGQGSLSTALVIAQGGKIEAMGTEENPIIFTSIYDTGDNLDETDMGLWGGIVILGYSSISADAIPANIEGVPVNEGWGLYGGTDSLDNSGIIKYVSIRHAGTLLGDGNELNGLTLGGVGSGTFIDNIEVVGNLDDGIECFGGNVTITNALVWAQGDDAFDIDQAFFGTFDNFISIEGSDSDHALEIDGGEGNWNAEFEMLDGTLISIDGSECHFRDGAIGYVEFAGQANTESDSGTSVVIQPLVVGADESKFEWTLAYKKGAL